MGTVFRQKGRSTWMIKYYRDGRPIYESSGTDIKDDAKKILQSREGAIADGRSILNKNDRSLRFADAVRRVENDYTIQNRRSLNNVKGRIRLHLAPIFGGRRMRTIDDDISAYITTRLQAGAKAATINRELAIVKRAFKLAKLPRPEIPKLEEHNVRTGFFEREQFEAVRRQLPAPWRPVMTFALLTGWRVRSEILPLTWAQVDQDAAIVRLEAGTTKNREGRTFPYGVLPELRDVIKDQIAVRDAFRANGLISPWLFPDDRGARLQTFYAKRWRPRAERPAVLASFRMTSDARRCAISFARGCRRRPR